MNQSNSGSLVEPILVENTYLSKISAYFQINFQDGTENILKLMVSVPVVKAFNMIKYINLATIRVQIV